MNTGIKRRAKPKKNNKAVFFIYLFVISFLLCLSRNFMATTIAEIILKNSLGVKVSIASLDLGFSTFTVKDLIIYNPEGFTGTLAKIPLVSGYYNLGTIIKNKPLFEEININIFEVTIAKNRNREINLNCLKAIATKSTKPKVIGPLKGLNLATDRLVLTMNHVRLTDYSTKEPISRNRQLGISGEKTYRLSNMDEIVRQVVTKVTNRLGPDYGTAVELK